MTTRILLWSAGFRGEIGGIETLARAMVRDMHGRGHEFEIVTPHARRGEPDSFDWNGIRVHNFAAQDAIEARDLAALAALRRRLESIADDFDADVLHVNHFHPALVLLLQSGLVRRLPLLYTVHGAVFVSSAGTGPETLAGRMLRTADHVVGCAAASLEDARRAAPEITSRSSLIRNALPTSATPAAPLPDGPPVVACLGRLVEQKGFDLALEAFATVVAEHPDARIVIAGDGPAMESLRARAAGLGLGERVEFPGRLDPEGTRALFAASHVVLMPSRDHEGIPMVAIEAAQAARPVIASDIPGLRETVVHGSTGLLVPPADAIALGSALGYLLADRDRARSLGEAASARIRAEFDWNDYLGAYASTYARLHGGNKSGDSR